MLGKTAYNFIKMVNDAAPVEPGIINSEKRLMSSCPLCDNQTYAPSWLGTTHYNGKDFEYVECQACKSLYCKPMPDEDTIAKMYGLEYFGLDHNEQDYSDTAERFGKQLAWLKKNPPSLLLDYGCGNGVLLEAAAGLGWQIAGVDFDPKVTERVSQRLGVKVVSDVRELGEDFQADVLHLGDVVEHLTNLNEQMPAILKLLKPGGVLLAQGPLEANTNLFTFYLKQSRKLRGKPVSEIPPYHVMLATAEGQRKCFNRFGLKEIEFDITEVEHPAPTTIGLSDFSNPLKVGMFATRRLSQAVTRLNSNQWGNRYFYAGKLDEQLNRK